MSILLVAAAFQAAAVASPAAPAATPADPVSVAPAPAVAAPLPATVLPKNTMLRLMVLSEVNSRDHKAGYRFKLRVDEDVVVDGVKLVPIGAMAWGEVTNAEGTGSAGKSGKIGAKLLYLDLDGRQVPLSGDRQTNGSGGTGQMVGGIVAFGVFGLFMKGNNASIKAGEIINGYTLEDVALKAKAAPGA